MLLPALLALFILGLWHAFPRTSKWAAPRWAGVTIAVIVTLLFLHSLGVINLR